MFFEEPEDDADCFLELFSLEESSDGFSEYALEVFSVENPDRKYFCASVWAAGFEEALTCGEVLAAVYLA